MAAPWSESCALHCVYSHRLFSMSLKKKNCTYALVQHLCVHVVPLLSCTNCQVLCCYQLVLTNNAYSNNGCVCLFLSRNWNIVILEYDVVPCTKFWLLNLKECTVTCDKNRKLCCELFERQGSCIRTGYFIYERRTNDAKRV